LQKKWVSLGENVQKETHASFEDSFPRSIKQRHKVGQLKLLSRKGKKGTIEAKRKKKKEPKPRPVSCVGGGKKLKRVAQGRGERVVELKKKQQEKAQ